MTLDKLMKKLTKNVGEVSLHVKSLQESAELPVDEVASATEEHTTYSDEAQPEHHDANDININNYADTTNYDELYSHGDLVDAPYTGQEELLTTASDLSQEKKKYALMHHLKSLFHLASSLNDTIMSYDLDIIDDQASQTGYNLLLSSLVEFKEKIITYLETSFNVDSYERASYIYFLLHGELERLNQLFKKITK